MNSTLVIVLVANIGFDTAENEHSDVSEKYWLLNGSVCEACERYTKLLRICFVGAAENRAFKGAPLSERSEVGFKLLKGLGYKPGGTLGQGGPDALAAPLEVTMRPKLLGPILRIGRIKPRFVPTSDSQSWDVEKSV